MTPKIISDFHNLNIESRYKTILLDFDNTCYEYLPCHHAGLKAVQSSIEDITGPIENFLEKYLTAQIQIKKRIPKHAASHNRVLYFLAFFEQMGRNDAHVHVANLEKTYWNAFMSSMVITPGLDTFLEKCKQDKVTVVIVSDLTATIQCEKIKHLGIADKIDFLVTTEEAGADKPDPAPFLIALEKSNGNIETTLMIGDDLEKDIVGAKTLGIDTIIFKH